MHNNYYFLRQFSRSLHEKISGSVVSECFSQQKDELIIRFEIGNTPFFLKASLASAFTCLAVPHQFQRAKRNSADIFPDLIGQRVTGVRQFENERSFALLLSDGVTMLFKMHGNRSNIILLQDNEVTGLFRNNLSDDESLDIDLIDRNIDWSYEAFIAAHSSLPSLYFTFGKPVWKYLEEKDFSVLPPASQWALLQETRQRLESPTFYIQDQNGLPHFSLLPSGDNGQSFTDPLEAVTTFYYSFTQQFAFAHAKQTALSFLLTRHTASESYLEKTRKKLKEIEEDTNYKIQADLIMAHLHALKAGMTEVTLPDFYREGHMVLIKLKRELSPQKNAEVFYRKSKNQQTEINHLQQSVSVKEKEIQVLNEQISAIHQAVDLKSIRALRAKLGIDDVREQQEVLPFREVVFNGFTIRIGKNAQSNDVLTLRYAFKEDLWFHTKDVAGSHVILKYQSGKKFPKDVIERAAQIAAWNSKRRNESLCPVAYTPKKYVRKRKGDPAGLMVVEREEVIMVVPEK